MPFGTLTPNNAFSQSDAITALSVGPLKMDAKYHAFINDGYCYMLAMEWLNVMFNSTEYKPMPFTPINDKITYHKQIAMNFVHYSSTFKKKDEDTLLKEFRLLQEAEIGDKATCFEKDKYFIDLCSNKKMAFNNSSVITTTAQDAATALDTANFVYCVCTIVIQNADGTKSGHAVAFYNLKDKLHFFDPNFGLFIGKTSRDIFDAIYNTYPAVIYINLSFN
jgi:hypothetical protein